MSLLDDVCFRAAAGGDAAFVGYDEISEWPEAGRGVLLTAGILRPAQPVTSIVCDACYDGHIEVPEVIELPGAPPRAYIPCPSYGRAAVDLARLKRWHCDAEAIALSLSRLLQASDGAAELAGVGWRLGPVGIAGAQWQAIVVADFTQHTREKLRRFRRPLALALDGALALDDILVLPAARVLRIEDKALGCDWRYLESECAASARPGAAGSSLVAPPLTRGRPVGRGLGALLDCWIACHRLDNGFLNIHDFYIAVERYLQKHRNLLSPLPPLASFTARRSEGKAKRARTGHCNWVGCAKAPLPSDLVSD